MIRRRRLTIAWTLALLLLSSSPALAQDDSVLQRYDLAIENLQFAVAAVPGDGVQARDELERAINALLTLSRDTTSASLVQAMERTFERARTAVENQSRTDMAVQAAVLTGGFRRLVMDAAFTAAASGDLETARSRLSHLASGLGFDASSNAGLAAATDDTALRLAFEAGTATSIDTELTVAGRLLGSDRDQAYVALATAYGNSLMIQDSPRADAGLNAHMVGAAQGLVSGDDEAMLAALQEASALLTRLANAAVSGVATLAPTVAAPTAAAPEPAAEQVESAPPASETPSAPAATEVGLPSATEPVTPAATATPAGSVEAPATAEQTATAVGDLDALLSGDPAAFALFVAGYEAEQRAQQAATLAVGLRAAGLPEGSATLNSERLVAAGYTSLDAVKAALTSPALEAVAAIRAGDVSGAQAAIARVSSAFSGPVAAVATAADAAAASETIALLGDLAEKPGLRVQDVTLLANQVDQVARSLSGSQAATPSPIELSVNDVWSSWTRLGVLALLGIFAFVPLRLLNIAFGGGNANWRLVAIALFLLLLPAIYEAVAAVLSAVAELADMPNLEVLGAWSMFTSTTGQAAWAALVLLALILATIGLRGICVQFGLLGSRNRPGLAGSNQTPTLVDSPRSTKPSAADWDEEF